MKFIVLLVGYTLASFAQENMPELNPIDHNTASDEVVLKSGTVDKSTKLSNQKNETKDSVSSENPSSSNDLDLNVKNNENIENDGVREKQIKAPSPLKEFSHTLSVLADAAPLSMWIPYKMGGSLSWGFHSKWQLELSGLKGKIDLDSAGVDGVGDSSEFRLDAVLRRQFGSSFQLFGGYSYQSVKAEASEDVRTNSPSLPFYDTTVKTQGILLGIGNRWVWGSGFTLGLDWISAVFPLTSKIDNDLRKIDISQYGSSQDKQDIEDAIDKIEKIPRLTILHIKIGWTF